MNKIEWLTQKKIIMVESSHTIFYSPDDHKASTEDDFLDDITFFFEDGTKLKLIAWELSGDSSICVE